MTYYDDKPKNDKLKNDYSDYRERGGCLTAFLGFAVIANILAAGLVLVLFSEVSQYSGADTGMFTVLVLVSIFSAVAAVACVYGLWNWKRWGYNGLMGLYVLGIIVNLLSGSFTTIGGSVLGMAILYWLMKDKMHYLD